VCPLSTFPQTAAQDAPGGAGYKAGKQKECSKLGRKWFWASLSESGEGRGGAKWKVESPEPARMIGCLTKKSLDHDHASAEQRFERWLRLCSHVIMSGQVHEAHIKEG